jgi:hypothetical protein
LEGELKTLFEKAPYHIVNTGEITALLENMYIQVDYLRVGTYVHKYLILEDKKTKTTKLQIVSGPYREDYDAQKVV